jgi:hypothetical protein
MGSRAKPKAQVAQDEVDNGATDGAVSEQTEPKSVEWKDLNLKLPNQLPGDVLFSFAAFEEQLEAGEIRLTSNLRLVKSIVGPAQAAEVRATANAEGWSMQGTADEIGELLKEILGQYGLGLGESSASQDA